MEIARALAVVTGGASGLGEAVARGLRGAGARVAILDRDEARGRRVADEIDAAFEAVDVTDEASVGRALEAARASMGGLDACVACAGVALAERTVGRSGPHGMRAFRRALDVNLVGSFAVASRAAALMAENPGEERGAIVLTASVAAFEGQKGQAAYAASKGGVAGLVLPMARDLASLGIRVVAIAPGVFRTPMLEGLGSEVMEGLAADVPFPRRLGDPAEFAHAVRFALEAGYLNGTVIRLDGGLRMR